MLPPSLVCCLLLLWGTAWPGPLQRAQGELLFFTHLCFLLVGFGNESFGVFVGKVRRMLRKALLCHPTVSVLCQLCPVLLQP